MTSHENKEYTNKNYEQKYELLKRCVLSFFFKVSIESHFLISKGRLFYNRGAQTEKAREP